MRDVKKLAGGKYLKAYACISWGVFDALEIIEKEKLPGYERICEILQDAVLEADEYFLSEDEE